MCSKVLFVLLVVIIVLAIIIFIIHNCKKETFDLGESIDNLVDGALGSVSDTMNELDDNDALIDIEYNNAPIYINTDGDLHAYDKNDSHHSSEITSGDAVSKHDYIHHIRRRNGHKRRHHHHHHESHHHNHDSHHHNHKSHHHNHKSHHHNHDSHHHNHKSHHHNHKSHHHNHKIHHHNHKSHHHHNHESNNHNRGELEQIVAEV